MTDYKETLKNKTKERSYKSVIGNIKANQKAYETVDTKGFGYKHLAEMDRLTKIRKRTSYHKIVPNQGHSG